MQPRFIYSVCGAALLALVAGPVSAANPDGRLMSFTMTTTMQMQGMSMPPHSTTRNICTAPGAFDPRQLVGRGMGAGCKLSDYRKAGSTITYHVACTQPQPLSSDGSFQQLGDGGFKGEMHTTTTAGGRAITVLTTYEGRQVGTCPYTPPAK